MPALPGQSAILFDLDGTLTDPFVGIARSIQFAMQELGRAIPDAESLRRFIGPPLQVTFPQLLDSDDAALTAEALRLYRLRYAETGKFENTLIPGITEVVRGLKESGFFLSVATSKLETYSVDIVEHFGLAPFFDAVHGSQIDGSRINKSDLVAHIVQTERLQPERTVMIGDRLHDVAGARTNAIPTIGVLWGFGDRTELEEAGAAQIAQVPEDIPALVDGLLRR